MTKAPKPLDNKSNSIDLDQDNLIHNRLKKSLRSYAGIYLPRQKRRRQSIKTRGKDKSKYTTSEIQAILKLEPNYFEE